MRRKLIGTLLAILSVSLTLPVPAQSTAPPDEVAIRAVVQKETDGWSNFDAAKVASCFTADITWQNPFGVRIRSREQLQKFLTNLLQRPGYRSAKDTTAPHVTDIHILSPTSAAVWSEEKSEGQIDDATGKPMAPRFSHYLEVFVKKDGAWFVSDSIIMDEYPRPEQSARPPA